MYMLCVFDNHNCTTVSMPTFPDEWRPFQIMRQTTTHDKNRVPTSSHCIPPSPLASPTINVPFSPAFRSIKGWFFCNTRCLKHSTLPIEQVLKIIYLQKKFFYLLPKFFNWCRCFVVLMKLFLGMIRYAYVVRCGVISYHKTRFFVPPTI